MWFINTNFYVSAGLLGFICGMGLGVCGIKHVAASAESTISKLSTELDTEKRINQQADAVINTCLAWQARVSMALTAVESACKDRDGL